MIEPSYLIALFSLTAFYFIFDMLKKGDDLHAFSFITLYIYTIFAQIGYAYFPQVSILMNAYFGPDLFYSYWLFIFLSLSMTFMVYKLLYRRSLVSNFVLYKGRGKHRLFCFYFSALLLFLILVQFFVRNKADFSWGTANPMGSQWFALGYHFFSIYCVVFYSMWRNNSKKGIFLLLSFTLFAVSTVFYIAVATVAGTRSDILYMFIALAIYELSPIINSIKTRKRQIFNFFVIAIVLIGFLLLLSQVRESSDVTVGTLFAGLTSSSTGFDDASIASLLMQDYYAPSHTLFVSMQYNIIDFFEVVKSDLANSLFLLKYPYLSETVTSTVDINTERGVGWAFYIFTEGYNAMGWFGVLYNAILFNIALALFLASAKSNNIYFNKILFSILFLFIVTCIRSQYSEFFKTTWLMIIPSIIITSLALNSRISFKFRLH